MKKHYLLIKQLDEKFEKLRNILFYFENKHNSIKTIRKALGMTGMQLAKRIGVNRSRLTRMEADEVSGALTIRTLEKVAQALNCHLVYALVPNRPLQDILKNQAYIVAKKQVEEVSHNMALENQTLSSAKINEQIETVKKNLLSKSLKNLWRDG